MSRLNYDSEATVHRVSYVGNAGTYAETGSYYGFFQPVDSDNNTIALQVMGQAYQFVTDGAADIQPSDKLFIDSVEYRVRGIRRNAMKRHDFLTVTLELTVKDN